MDDAVKIYLGCVAFIILVIGSTWIDNYLKIVKVKALNESGFTSEQISCIVYNICK